MKVKLSLECEYCGFMPNDDEPINGLDRVDSSQGYTDSNTVPCCATCNSMKGSLDVNVFIDNVRKIVRFRNLPIVAARERTRMSPFSGRTELRAEGKKAKVDHLTNDDKIRLWSAPCYLCGRSPSFGIDREDASDDYTVENSRSCCRCHHGLDLARRQSHA